MAVKVAIQYYEQIGAVKIVEMFGSFGFNVGIFYFLGAALNTSTDPEVHFKYLQVYDATAVKNFLKEAKLLDPRPLIYVCDLHDFVEELTDYFFDFTTLGSSFSLRSFARLGSAVSVFDATHRC